MISADRPHHQSAIDTFQTLLATRYDAVVQRLVYPEPGNKAFTDTIFEAANDARYVGARNGEYTLRAVRHMKFEFTLLDSIPAIEGAREVIRRGSPKLGNDEIDWMVVTHGSEELGERSALEQIQWFASFGLIGAMYKPRVEDVRGVLRQERRDATPGDLVFRRVVKTLAKYAIQKDEEAAISKGVNKLETQLDNPIHKEGSKAKLTRYHNGIVARRVLEALLDPHTTAQHLQDEMDVLYSDMPTPYRPHTSRPDGSIPTITLPWPILPPGERPSREIVAPKPPLEPRAEAGKQHIIYDELRTKWLGALVLRWPYGARFGKVELHNKTADKIVDLNSQRKMRRGAKSRYRAAVLKGPDNRVFAVIADTSIAVPANAMYVGLVRKLINKQGQPVNWRRVFKHSKEEARDLGAIQFRHNKKATLTDQTVQERVMDFVCEAFEEEFGFHPFPKLKATAQEANSEDLGEIA